MRALIRVWPSEDRYMDIAEPLAEHELGFSKEGESIRLTGTVKIYDEDFWIEVLVN